MSLHQFFPRALVGVSGGYPGSDATEILILEKRTEWLFERHVGQATDGFLTAPRTPVPKKWVPDQAGAMCRESAKGNLCVYQRVGKLKELDVFPDRIRTPFVNRKQPLGARKALPLQPSGSTAPQ